MSSVRATIATVWLGFYHDVAWTNPLAGVLVTTISPISAALTTSIIFWLGSTLPGGTGLLDPTRLAFVLVGAILYTHTAAYAWVPTQAIAEGKNLSVFPHVYITPRSSALYVAGRAFAAFMLSGLATVVALASAWLILGAILHVTIPLTVTPLTAALFGLALVVNLPGALGLGYLLGAYTLFASKFEWALPGYVAGLLMVFSGALFPVTVLPGGLATAAAALPFTNFIDAARDAIVYNSPGAWATAIGYTLAGDAVFLLGGLAVYRWAEKRARREGVIDRRLA